MAIRYPNSGLGLEESGRKKAEELSPRQTFLDLLVARKTAALTHCGLLAIYSRGTQSSKLS